jgi:hypothetical protein
MPLRVTCPGCKTAFVCPDDYVGKRLQCQQCRQQFVVGGAAPPAAPPPPPAEPKAPSAVRPPAAVRPAPRPRPTPQVTTDFPAAPPKREAAPAAAGPPPKQSRRGLVVGALAAVVLVPLLCCGLPVGGVWWYWRRAPDSAGAPGPVATEQANQAPAPAPAPTPPGPGKGIDLTYVTADFNGAVLLHPRRLAQAPLLAPLLQDPSVAELTRMTGIDPRTVERVLVLTEPFPNSGGKPPPPGPGPPQSLFQLAAVVHFGAPVDGKKLLEKAPGGVEEKSSQGKTYYRSKDPQAALAGARVCAYVADGRTLVVAPEPTLHKMLAARDAKSPLRDRLRAADLGHDVIAVLVVGAYRPLLAQAVAEAGKSLPPPLAGVRQLPEHLQAVTATLDLTGAALVKLTLEADNAEGAAAVEELAKSALEFGKLLYPTVREKLASDVPAEYAGWALGVADQFYGGVRVGKDGVHVTLTLPRPAALDAPPVPGLIASSGFNDAQGMNADPIPDSPFALGAAGRAGGGGEPGWANKWPASPGAAFQKGVVAEGDGALQLKGPGPYARQLARPQNGPFQVEQRVQVPAGGSLVASVSLPNGVAAGVVWHARDGKFVVFDGDGSGGGKEVDTGLRCEPGRWHKVVVRIDPGKRKWELSVDDRKYEPGRLLGLRFPAPGLRELGYRTDAPAGAYVDAVVVTHAPPLEAPPRQEPPSPKDVPGLLAYWALDEGGGAKAADSAPGGANGATVHGGKWVKGVRGGALELDGVKDYLDLGAGPGLNFKADAPFTVAGWVRTKRPWGTVVSLRNGKDGGALLDLVVADGRAQAQVREDGKEVGQHAVLTAGAVADGDWHHFALTRDGRSFELYLDGAAQGRATGRDAGGPITTDLRALGSERAWVRSGTNRPEQQFLQGALDEVCVFGRALSAAEVKRLAGVGP